MLSSTYLLTVACNTVPALLFGWLCEVNPSWHTLLWSSVSSPILSFQISDLLIAVISVLIVPGIEKQ